jgi:hypothetical protein
MNEVLAKIIELLKAEMPQIKTFYEGEVVMGTVPRSHLPAVMVFGNSTNVIAKSTCTDQYTYNITIRLVSDLMKFVSEKGTGEIIKAQEYLIDTMEKRDSQGVLENDTILGVMRKNIGTNKYLFNNDIRITYQTIQTGEFFYVKAEMNLTATTDILSR